MRTNKVHWGYSFIIVLFAFIQYSNTLGHAYAWDDKIVIEENERVQEGFSGIPELFKKYNSDLRQDQYGYRPVTLITFAIEYELSKGEPGLSHFMNILYFAALCLVLFLLLKRLFYKYSPLLPFLVTLLFTVHPIHVEVVANIKSRDEILALLFCLISLIHLLKFYELRKWKYLVYTLLFFVLGFLSKENAIVFLLIYPLTLFKVIDTNWKRILKITVIVVPVLAIIVFLISSYSQNSHLGEEKTIGLGIYQENLILGNAFFYVDHFIDKLADSAYLVLLYLKDFFVPTNLAYYHGQGDLAPVGFGWQSILGGLVSVFMLAFAVLRFKKYPIISYGILFFFFSISIYLHIVKSLSDTRADRFMFFASVGLSILLVGLLIRILKVDLKADTKVDLKKGKKQTLPSPLQSFNKLNISFKGVFIVLLGFFSVITFSRNSIWENDFTLVENDMERLDNSARPHYYFATNLNQQIQQGGSNREMEERMIYHYRRSIDLSDSIYYARLELGGYLMDQGRIDEGVAVFQEAVNVFPNTSDPRHYLGQALVQLEKYDKAVVQLEKSISLAPKSPDSYYLLAISYAKVGKLKKGEDLANKGLRKFPQASKSMYEALGHVYFEMDDMTKSTESTLKMIEHGGDSYKAYATVIGRYQTKGDDANAAKYYQSAIQQGIMQAQ